MSNNKEFQELPGKEHLKKDYAAELNYKLWITKGARFGAAKRLKKKNSLSVASIGFLSGYIIIINLFSFLPKSYSINLTPDSLTLITISLSILVLIFSQLETANAYNLKSDNLHRCGMEIGKLYNEWRYYKTLEIDDINLKSKILEITKRYESVLDKYENHDDIDTEMFKVKHSDYFKLSVGYVVNVYMNYYFKVYFAYHLLMISPVIAFIFSLGYTSI